MKITFYPYDFDYIIRGDRVFVRLFSKLEDGTKICVIDEHEAFFYVDTKKDIATLSVPAKDNVAKVTHVEQVSMQFLGKEKNVLKAFVNYPKAVPILAKKLKEQGIESYENNILFVHRYLRDKDITPMTLVQAEGEFIEKSELRVPTFMASSIQDVGKEEPKEWKILAVDIETYAKTKGINMQSNPILMIAFYGVDEKGKIFEKVITWKKFKTKHKYVEFVSDEAELLKRFKEICVDYQPDILTGYFSDGFDFPYILTRAQKHGVKLDIGFDYSEPRVRSAGGARNSEVSVRGMLHIDILKFIKYIFGKNLKTDSYSLDSVAHELLGKKKHDVNLDELAHIWDNEPEKLDDFCAYNLHDSHLTYKLCHQLLPDVIEFTKALGLPAFDVIRMRFSKLVENYILKRAIEKNVLAPNKPAGVEMEQRMREHVQGAFVFEPVPGLYSNIAVFDFRSLYPTIITAHNIGPGSFKCTCCKENVVPDREKYWFCTKQKGFLPTVLDEIVLRRADLKSLIKEQREKKKDTKMLEARSYALKILANSFYGYLGFFGARWYCIECAASTTAYARHYIQETITAARKNGFDVIYADTDSCFLLLGEKGIDDAFSFMKEINKGLPGHMELEFEGNFPRGIFVSVKGSEKGAKKKYALFKEDGQLKVVGFEIVRRNWSPLAKEVQKHVLELVLNEKSDEAIEYVKDVKDDLLAGNINAERLVITTQITRKLSEYKSRGPHVAVAHKMVEKGIPVHPGTMVKYVISKGKGLVREKAVLVEDLKEYDAEYYLTHQVIPAVSSILEVVGVSEEELAGKSKQTGLGNFM